MKPEILGVIAGICTAASLIPQLIKIIKDKKAQDISLTMLLILLTGLALWTWYGILRKDWPIIVTNSFSLLVNIAVLIFSIKFKKKNGDMN